MHPQHLQCLPASSQPRSLDAFSNRGDDDGVAVDGQRYADSAVIFTSVGEAELRSKLSHDREHAERKEYLVAAENIESNRGQKYLFGDKPNQPYNQGHRS